MPKILVTGANGYLGSNLRQYLKAKDYDVYGITSKEVNEKKVYRLDITCFEDLVSLFKEVKPNIIIHTAAINSLSECEKDHNLAIKVNVNTTKNIINAISQINSDAKLIFISSDYVFDGRRGNYREDDEVNPQTFYGKTKVLSENDLRNNLENYIICRTANIYGRGGGNFFNFVINNLNQGKIIDVFDNVFFTPTYIDYLLDSLMELINIDYKGIIHIAGRERLSRYDFALKIVESLGSDKTLINPSKQTSSGFIAMDSSLNSEYSRTMLKNDWPSIEESLHYCFGNLIKSYFNFNDNRGKFVGIFQDYRWKEINYVESANSSVRGNHYHKQTVEGFFIIEGKIRICLIDFKNNSKRIFIAKKGDIVIVKPYTLHTFEIIEDSKWINMLSRPLKGSKDFHRLPEYLTSESDS